VGSEVLLEQVELNFSFRNKFTIVLPCGRIVDNNTFSKMCIFKSLIGYTDYGGYENQNAHFLIIMKYKVMKSLCLLHDQNDGWAVPYSYLKVCCKNIYLGMLFKEAYIA
jgi:hypothetical protein